MFFDTIIINKMKQKSVCVCPYIYIYKYKKQKTSKKYYALNDIIGKTHNDMEKWEKKT